jgi:hypothetical protein
MAALRYSARTVAVVFVVGWLLQAGGCGTDAVGVSSCRDIELARCDAAASCGTVDDAAECRRFYHDQCLHGLPVSDPGRSAVSECVEMLERARVCADEDRETQLGDCSLEVTRGATAAATACELVAAPELASECRFLAPDAEVPEPNQGGAPNQDPEPAAGSGGAASEGSPDAAGSGGAASEGSPDAGGSGGAAVE